VRVKKPETLLPPHAAILKLSLPHEKSNSILKRLVELGFHIQATIFEINELEHMDSADSGDTIPVNVSISISPAKLLLNMT